ncbi:MAG: hypothetical protein ACRD3A_04965 [Terriglobales bacterium]
MTPESLARMLESYLAEARDALVLEDGQTIFDLETARYSVSAEHGKCVLHLWSPERNTVRRVLDAEVKHDVLRLSVQRFGQSKPVKLEVCRERDRRTPSARKAARAAYQRRLGRVLERSFPDLKVERLSSAMDLERSFGPIYCRGMLRRGRSAFAVLGVNAQETQPSIDASLTFGLLWLEHCRQREAARAVVEGLKLLVPPGTSAVVRERMAHLNRGAAKFELYELAEPDENLEAVDTADRGNIATRLVRCPDEAAARERFAASIARMTSLLPEAEAVVLAPSEMAFRLHGLEFARARLEPERGSFRSAEQIVFGVGANETVLDDRNAPVFENLLGVLRKARRADGGRENPVWRMRPERWLESLVVRDVSALDSRLDPAAVYSQVPAFSASDRAMIDVLAATREGRLAVLELKADEDIHLPLQGLDYWARVSWHHARGEFQQYGYFPGRQLSPEAPLLLLVAPALRVHPATDTLLRYLAPEIECTLLGVDERWREGVRVVFRKRRTLTADSRG